MTAEHILPLYDQSSDQILDSIKKRRQDWGNSLTSYNIDIGLPLLLYSKESPLSCRETMEELEAVTSNFSVHIHRLFDALVTCQDLDAKIVEDDNRYLHSQGLFLSVEIQKQSFDRYLDCHHRTYHSNRLELKDPNALPQVSCVTKFRLLTAADYTDGFANVRPISLRVPLELLMHLPAIQELECPWLWERMPVAFPTKPMRHYSQPWEGPWRDARHDFGRAALELNDTVPNSLRRARLWFWQAADADEDQSVQMPNLVHPADIDPLSLGLRTFASHLEEMDLRAFLMPDFFDAQTPWPRMKRMRVEFHPWRPDGSWYFVGPRGEDPNSEGFQITDERYPPVITTEEDKAVDDKHNDYEEEWYEEDERWPDMFRTEPLAVRIEPLLANFAETLKGTVSLEEAEFFTYLSWYPSEKRQSEYKDDTSYDEGVHRWGLKYTAAKGDSKASVEWQVGDWRPGGHITELFEALGGDGGAEVTWKAFEFAEHRKRDDPAAFC
jgi:hypothetical protein